VLAEQQLADERPHRMRKQRERHAGIGRHHLARHAPRIIHQEAPAVRVSEVAERLT
jgi:hypothetical protein